MHLVHLAQQCVAHLAPWELFSKMLGPVLQGHASLPLQGFSVYNPLNLMWLQEFQSESLSSLEILVWNIAFFRRPELMHQRQLLIFLFCEAYSEQPSNFVFSQLKDFTEGLIGEVSSMARFLNNFAKFELNDIINLLFS